MKFTKMPTNTFKQLQLNAGILLSSFVPDTAEASDENMIGATTGGVNFTATPEYSDFGEDIDNCPANVKELKQLDRWTATMTGTFVAIDGKAAARLVGAGDFATNKVTPRNDILDSDFTDLWWVGDYSDINNDGSQDGKAGYIAIHMMNSLSTGGFQIQTGNREKGQFAFEFTAHYSMAEQDKVPYEIYIQAGSADE